MVMRITLFLFSFHADRLDAVSRFSPLTPPCVFSALHLVWPRFILPVVSLLMIIHRQLGISMTICWFVAEYSISHCCLRLFGHPRGLEHEIRTGHPIFVFDWNSRLTPRQKACLEAIRLTSSMIPMYMLPFDMRLFRELPPVRRAARGGTVDSIH
jgi:hypothetical protein